MKPIDKRLLVRYVLCNLSASSFLVLLMWYTGRVMKGIWDVVGIVLYAPSFIILSILRGMNEALHFTTYNMFLAVSFIFYSAVIALIQIFIYKRKKKQAKL